MTDAFKLVDGEQLPLTDEDRAWLETVAATPEPEPVMPDLTDRQFFQGLAEEEIISWAEAEAAVGPGTIPQELLTILEAAITDPKELARARVKVTGAVTFRFTDALVPIVQAAKGWSDDQLKAFWLFCASLN
jgi:hypothetical protein